jgi:hypothetical protein
MPAAMLENRYGVRIEFITAGARYLRNICQRETADASGRTMKRVWKIWCATSPEPPFKKINVDNKARFRYPNGYWFRLIDASICWAAAEVDTQVAIFTCYAPKKQCLIFLFLSFRKKIDNLYFLHYSL